MKKQLAYTVAGLLTIATGFGIKGATSRDNYEIKDSYNLKESEYKQPNTDQVHLTDLRNNSTNDLGNVLLFAGLILISHGINSLWGRALEHSIEREYDKKK